MTPNQITEALAAGILAAKWPDGDISGFPSRRIAGMIADHLARDVVLPLIEQETAAVRVAYREAEANEDRLERLLVSLLADLTEQYEKAREERDQHDEYSNYWRWLDGICEGLDRAIQRAKYAPDTTTTEPVEPDPFTDNDVEDET